MRNLKALLIQHPSPRTTFAVPLGLGYLAAILKSKGVSVKIIDGTAPYAEYDDKKIVEMIEQEHFDLIGVTITTIFSMFAYDLIGALPKRNTLIVTGGPHVSLYPHESLRYGAHISARGEGEQTISEIVDYLCGEKRLEEILGISYIDKNEEIIDNPPRPLIDNLDNLPLPAKEVFRFEDYVQNESDTDKFNNILSSRGCLGRCTFCSREVSGRKYRYRSPENILAEIKFLNKKYGLKHFSFVDDAMTLNPTRINLLCDIFQKEIDFGLSWSCVTRVDFVKPELLKKMQQAGCIHISYGIESANPETLKKIKKDVSIEKIEYTLSKTKEAGIQYSLNFMWGFPWESAEDIENSINFMKKLSTSASWINSGGILIPFPGTELYECYKKEYGFENWWLRREEFTSQYRIRKKGTLFRYFFFEDQGLLEGNGYFNYSKSIKKKIEKAVRYIGNFNLKQQPPIYYLSGLLFVYLSRGLYKISYKLEIYLQIIFFSLLGLKHKIKESNN